MGEICKTISNKVFEELLMVGEKVFQMHSRSRK